MKNNIKRHLLTLLAVPALALSVAGAVAAPAYAVDPADAVDPASCSTDGGILSAANCAKSADQPTSLFDEGGVFQDITNILLFIIGAVSVIMLIIGGIRYTISQGDSSAITGAKNTILYAVIGIVVALLAFAIVNYVLVSLVADPVA